MDVLLFFISLCLFFYMWNSTRDMFFPGCILNLVWSIVSFLYCANFGDLYVVEYRVYVILLIGLLCINIPFIYFIEFHKIPFSVISSERYKSSVVIGRSNALLIIQILLLLAMIPFAQKMSSVADNLAERRLMYATNAEHLMSSFERQIYVYFVVFPAISAQNVLVCLLFFKKSFARKSQKFIHMILMLTLIMLLVIANGGRTVLFSAMLCFFLAIGFSITSNRFVARLRMFDYKKEKRKIIVFFLAAFVLGVWVTLLRTSNQVDIPLEYSLRMIARYFTIGPSLFGLSLDNPNAFGLDSYTYGGVFLGGIIEIIRIFFSLMGVDIVSFFGTAQQYMNDYYEIGSGIYANAFPTMFYYFMRDFGFIGVPLESLIIGVFALVVYVKSCLRVNILLYALFFVMINIFVYGVCWWPYYRPESIVVCIYIILISKIAAIKFYY